MNPCPETRPGVLPSPLPDVPGVLAHPKLPGLPAGVDSQEENGQVGEGATSWVE